LEVQPFGKFSGKNDYKGSDLYREETPKLAIAVYGGYNMGSNKSQGTVGMPILDREADLLTYGGDITFKYNGFSVLAEVGSREVTDGETVLYDPISGEIENSFYSGFGANLQSGYVFKNNWEVVGRYAFTNPTNIDVGRDVTDYTIGVNKFIIGHAFKLQADVTYREIEGKNEMYIGRLQLEFQF
jgi:hypothetical protein